MNDREVLIRWRPGMVRLMARTHPKGPALSTRELVAKSGLQISDVYFITWSQTWDHVKWGHMNAFLDACGDPRDAYTEKCWFKYLGDQKNRPPNRAFVHLKKHEEWPMFERLLEWSCV
jgi:hypothetical protein